VRRLRNLTVALAALAAASTVGARASTPVPLEGIPRFSHVVVLPLENESEGTTFGAASPAKYLNSLRAQGLFLPNYYGAGHNSLPNYIAMVSGQLENPAESLDCIGVSLYDCAQLQLAQSGGRNLGDQLDDAHVSWGSYMDSTPTPCFHAAYSPSDTAPDPYEGDTQKAPARDYADRHNPFVWFPDFTGNPVRCAARQHPYTQLAAALKHNTLPQFAFITPDTCHDGHDNPCSNGSVGGLTSADAWLRANIPPLLQYLRAHNGLLVINFDEGSLSTVDPCEVCAAHGAGGRTGAILLSPRLRAGTTVATQYDHMSLLRTIEDSFGISEHLNLAAAAAPMTDAFARAHS
jgi:phospholipase C